MSSNFQRPIRSPKDAAFLDDFESGRLPPAAFDHRAHLRLAWLSVRELPLELALQKVATGIRRFATAAGVPEKFHATLTAAAVNVVASRQAQRPTTSFDAFCEQQPDLVTDLGAVIGAHYSKECLASVEARQHVVEPDLASLPTSKGGRTDLT